MCLEHHSFGIMWESYWRKSNILSSKGGLGLINVFRLTLVWDHMRAVEERSYILPSKGGLGLTLRGGQQTQEVML